MQLYNQRSQPRSLYIHWPFCPYKCHFCPFVALASHDHFMDAYHKALQIEIEQFAQQCDSKLAINTVYMGGGTPSTYPDNLLLDMFGTLKSRFTLLQTTEITIEVNPGTVRVEQLALWKSIGINRLSIGVQSLNDRVLQQLNRHQKVHDVFFVLEQARNHFTNISIDLILGLPGITPDEWRSLIHTVVAWPITHLSVYFLTVHEDTPLYFKVKTRAVTLFDDDTMVDTYHWTCQVLAQNGFEQYEMSNFARPGYQSRHNTVYWDRKAYKGFGLGACSFDGNVRLQNEKNITKYIEGITHERDVTIFNETLTKKQIHIEKLMLSLRRATGVALSDIMGDLSEEQQKQFDQTMVWLRNNGLVIECYGNIRLTPAGLVVENEVIARLSY